MRIRMARGDSKDDLTPQIGYKKDTPPPNGRHISYLGYGWALAAIDYLN